MTGLQRYGIRSGCPACGPNYADHDLIPVPDGMPDEPGFVVLAADAEAAISAAEQRHSDEDGLMQAQAFDDGERHMLAKCIEVVDAERKWWRDTHFGTTHLVAGEWNDSLQNVLAVLRGLEEKP